MGQWNSHSKLFQLSHNIPSQSSTFFSKRNGFWKLQSIRSSEMYRALWSDGVTSRWCTFVSGNIKNQSLVAITRSSLSHTMNSTKCLCQVKGKPTNSKSMKPHLSSASREDCIWLCSLDRPPCFSNFLVISLKSPRHNHVDDPRFFRFRNFT